MSKRGDYILVDKNTIPAYLMCPICKSKLVWPYFLNCEPAGNTEAFITITHDGFWAKSKHNKDDSYPEITLLFFCDSGHEFGYSFRLYDKTTRVWRYVWDKSDGPQKRPLWRT